MTPNVLLVVLDSVRASNVGLYDYQRETTPFLTDFAEDATVYTQARSPGIHSIASHASLFTGLEVEEHRAVEHESRLDTGTTIWEELAESDYETGLFTPNTVVTLASNLDEFFDTVEGPREMEPTEYPFPEAIKPFDLDGDLDPVAYGRAVIDSGQPVRGLANGVVHKFGSGVNYAFPDESGDYYADRFLEWVDQADDWAACLNFMDAHYPYLPKPEYDRWADEALRTAHESLPSGALSKTFLPGDRPWWQLEAFEHLYDGAIRQADAAVHRVVEGLRARGELDDTLVVVTSDHGEGFGEWSRVEPPVRLVDHSWGISEALTHVPLVVSYPEQTTGETVREPVSLTEFPSVVRSALAGDIGDDAFRRDEPVVSSTYRVRDLDSEVSAADDPSLFAGPWRAVYEPDEGGGVRKYATHGTQSATITVPEPGQTCRVSHTGRDRVESAFAGFDDAGVLRDDAASLDEGVQTRLEELGYVA